MRNPTIAVDSIEPPAWTVQEAYKKHPLDLGPKSIRVLDILPLPIDDSDNAPIKAHLRVEDLGRNPDFTALSYVWGTHAPQPHVMRCDDVRFKITSNCHSALWHLRKKLGGFTIWLDAICINQENASEKTQQIPLMSDIYMKATLVYVWLGEGSSETDRAMAYLSNSHFQKHFNVKLDGSKVDRPYAAAWSLYASAFNPAYHPLPFMPGSSRFHWLRSKPWIQRKNYVTWLDLDLVLKREWTQRVWTYQEILLASHPVLVCGNAHLTWAALERSALFLCNIRYDSCRRLVALWEKLAFDRERLGSLSSMASSSTSFTLQDYQAFIRQSLTIRQHLRRGIPCIFIVTGAIVLLLGLELLVYGKYGHTAPMVLALLGFTSVFFNLIYLSFNWYFEQWEPSSVHNSTTDDLVGGIYRRESKEPIDMAYGMWGILQKRGANDLPLPTYDQEITKIYWVLTINLIRVTSSLEFLPFAAARGQPGAPSWVPDWSAYKKQDWIREYDFPGTNTRGQSMRTTEEVARICNREKTGRLLSIGEADTVLTVRAREIGSICGCASFRKTSVTFRESEKDLHLANLRAMFLCASWTPDIRSYMRILGLVVVDGDQWPKHVKKWDKYYKKSRREELERFLRLHSETHDAPARFTEFLHTHTTICNMVAQADRQICSTISLANLYEPPYLDRK
ncbi:uncharacterized protein K460DRAFT_420244 [Cucurbitaria berberidis CBS 394.84]|uniref:Heterokaryon incompatibility domain-containing protein n=1 Tax=Cucurbitaria berberidis CBS 394.84 TaxID=1168544 RepID=A0A9P4GB57_9PLEO|nr:uncharacterized protein K460DRAFT_420244 [Cucurbitaria berberidis CBS 394.84]KAF1842326.1 hypothetical protein K460DRAFT_420244 [Cucurbitaria berberidis CBS 394.84]